MQRGRFTKDNIAMIEQACKHLELNPQTYFKSESTYLHRKELQERLFEQDLKVKRDF